MTFREHRLRVALLIDRLGYGGADRQFVTLATALQKRGHSIVAIVFYDNGPLECELRTGGVTVYPLGKRGRWDLLRLIIRLARVIRRERPDVLHGYTGVPNLVALLMKPLFHSLKVVWGVRASDMRLRDYGWLPPILGRLSAALSRVPDAIISNSWAGRAHVLSRGYPPDKVVVIPNGIDTDRFSPDNERRWRVRAEWGVSSTVRLVGLVGRLDPMKGHQTFMEAAAMIARRHDDVQFVCVGDGPLSYAAELRSLASHLGLQDRLRWVAQHPDMPGVYNALDVLCSASTSGEGFANVLGEALACGVPCVVTDVGDSAWIVARPHFTVPSEEPRALARRLDDLLSTADHDLARMAHEGRQRVVTEFSVSRLASATEDALWAVTRCDVSLADAARAAKYSSKPSVHRPGADLVDR